MKLNTAYRHLDRHGRQRAPEVIAEEVQRLEPHLARFHDDLVRLEVVASQTRGKTRIRVSLRLQLPTGPLAVHEEGFEIEPVLRKAFSDLRHRVDRQVARLRREQEWKRPARRARIGALLPAASDRAEADRRALYFDLIEDHIDTVYDVVRRELTYLEASGTVPDGRLSVRDLVDATILGGLERFESRPTTFSVGAWLTRLAFETIEAEARAARRAVPEDALSTEADPAVPAEDPTETDQELFEYYQPDESLRLEDLVSDDTAVDPQTAVERRETALALHRALAALPALWRRVLLLVELGQESPDRAASMLGLSESDLGRIAQAARDFLAAKLQETAPSGELSDELFDVLRRWSARMPQPLHDRERLRQALVEGDREEAA